MRLQKYLSQQGTCSRREAERYIEKGLIFINGQPAQIGQSIDPDHDVITLDESIIEEKENKKLLRYYKPRGVVTNCPHEGEKEIKDLLESYQKCEKSVCYKKTYTPFQSQRSHHKPIHKKYQTHYIFV